MIKKQYMRPQIQTVRLRTSSMICQSPLNEVLQVTTVEMEEDEEFE